MKPALRHVIKYTIAVTLAVCLAGCASLIKSLQDPPVADLQLDVPIVLQQDAKQCGVAALTMVTRYYRRELSDAKYQNLVALVDKQNVLSGADLVQALRGNGYYVALFSGTMDETATGLRYNISRGRPLIVMLQREAGGNKFQHYVVLIGYYINSGDWLIVDPQLGKRIIKADKFMAEWAAAGYFTLLTMPENNKQTTTRSMGVLALLQ